jgi:hypothetical protein
MPVVKITKQIDLIFNEDRYFVYIDNKFIKGFGTLEQADEFAAKLVLAGGKEKADEVTIKEIIC